MYISCTFNMAVYIYIHTYTLPTSSVWCFRPAFMGFPDLESKCPPQQWKSSSHLTLFTAKTQTEAKQSAEIQLVNGNRLPRAKMGVTVYLHTDPDTMAVGNDWENMGPKIHYWKWGHLHKVGFYETCVRLRGLYAIILGYYRKWWDHHSKTISRLDFFEGYNLSWEMGPLSLWFFFSAYKRNW